MTETIQLAHGAGGRMSALLTEEVLRPILGNPILDRLHEIGVMQYIGIVVAAQAERGLGSGIVSLLKGVDENIDQRVYHEAAEEDDRRQEV